MTPENDSDNRRSSYDDRRGSCRLPIVSSPDAVLVVNDERYPVVLEDQSAGGFGIRAQAIPPLESGDLVCLETDEERFEARVAHVAMVEKKKKSLLDGDFSLEITVGLERRQDLPPPKKRRGWLNLSTWRSLVPFPADSQLSTLVPGIVLALAAAAIPATVLLVIQYVNLPFPEFRWPSPASWRVPVWAQAPSRVAADDNEAPPADSPESQPEPISAETADLRSLRDVDLRDLLEPETIRRLGLTVEQQARIRDLVDTLDESAAAGSAEQPSSLPQTILDQLSQILTEEQRAQWQTARAEPAPPTTP